jgi:5'-nucleotidase / UDP-sugar diphosphatase
MASIRPIKFLALIIALSLPGFWTFSNSSAAGESQEKFSITILHTNDMHSHEDSFQEDGKTLGGIARIAQTIKTVRKSVPNVLVVDAGDIFQGTGYFEAYKGETDVECLNRAGYDVYTIGNHEFDEGPANLGKQLAKAKFEVTDCNLDFGSEPSLKNLVKPSVIKEIGGQKIGFIGVMYPELAELSQKLEGVKVTEPRANWKEPVKAEVEKLKKQGVNKIVVLSHCGIVLENELVALPDVDLVIGGHSHSRLDKPVVVSHADGTKAMSVQTGCFGRALGRLDLVFDADGRLLVDESKYRLIDMTDRVFEDPDLKAYVTEKAEPFLVLKKTILASAEANFDHRFKMYPTDSAIGDLICDALFDAGIENGVTISIQNRGGIRGGLNQGPISLEAVRELLPFPNTLVIATVTGKTLTSALENCVKDVGTAFPGGKFLDVHGIRFAWDPTLPGGKRIVYACAQNKEGNYEAIAPDDLYRLAVNSFTFKGGEEFDFTDAKDVIDTGLRLSTVFENYLKKVKKVTPQVPSRIVRVSSNIAARKKEAGRDVIAVDYPVPDSEVSVITGTDRGVSFLPRTGTVPLEKPDLLRSMKTDDGGRLEIPVSEISSARKAKEGQLWVAIMLKAKDKEGTTTKIVSVPIQIRQ